MICDTREQLPLIFTRLECERGTLATGDYGIAQLPHAWRCERKSIADLTSCITGDNRTRFEAELLRLMAFPFRRLIIVGDPSEITTHRYRSSVSPQSVFASLHCWQARYSLPFVFSPTPETAAGQLECWASWTFREAMKMAEALNA